MAKVKVLEVDQWTSTGNIEQYSFSDFDLGKVSGGDSETIRKIGIAGASVMEVEEADSPSIGRVWYREGKNGKLERWNEKANCDSSG